MKKSFTRLLVFLGGALLAVLVRYFFPKWESSFVPAQVEREKESGILTREEIKEVGKELTISSNWAVVGDENNQSHSDFIDQCVEERITQSWQYASYWEECKEKDVKNTTISRTQACSLSNGKHTDTYLPILTEIEGVYAFSEWFYKHNNQIYYIVNTSKESKFPTTENSDREMYLMKYDCSTQINNQLQKFEMWYVWPWFTIEYVWDTDQIDKILLKNHPYEWYGVFPYEWYTITTSLDITLTNLNIFGNRENHYSGLLITSSIRDQLHKETLQKCGYDARDDISWIASDWNCIVSYTIDSMTDYEIVFTVYVRKTIYGQKDEKSMYTTYKRTYRITY
jgi:hypothetical protein